MEELGDPGRALLHVIEPRRGEEGGQARSVLHLIGQLHRGGTELQLAHLVGDLSAQWRQTVASFWSGGEAEILDALADASCEVIDLGKAGGLQPQFLNRLARLVRRAQPDVIHTWGTSANRWGRVASLLSPRSAVVSSVRGQDTVNHTFERALERLLARRTHICICNSSWLREKLIARCRYRPERVRVIPNGVDCERFRPEARVASTRPSVGCPVDARLVTMVASLYPVKNWPMFLEVARRVTEQRSDVFFLGVGGGELLEPMRERAAALGLTSDRLALVGKRTDVPEIYAASDVAILTSDREGMPNTVLEAMACALPVVTTNISGSDELISTGRNGFLVEPGAAAQAAERVLELCDDPALRRGMGAEGRRRAIAEHSFERMAERHAEAYLAALELKRRSASD